MIAASQSSPLALFGLLSYVEPLLLVIVAVLIGEHIDAGRWPSYAAIWAAVMVYAPRGVLKFFKPRQSRTMASMQPEGRSSRYRCRVEARHFTFPPLQPY